MGNRYDIVEMVKKYNINRIIYAIPATTGKKQEGYPESLQGDQMPDADSAGRLSAGQRGGQRQHAAKCGDHGPAGAGPRSG